MRLRKFTLDQDLERAKNAAMRDLATWLDARFTEEISAVKWEYPTPPQVRDIVDTGRLRASQTRVVNPDGSVRFTWPVEYGNQVHEGGVSPAGLRYPGRPWTKAPMAEAPAKFGSFLRARLQRGS
jgi:hypothetical protein